MTASHEFLDHTAELTVRLRAGSAPELFQEAARALAEVTTRGVETEPAPTERVIELAAPDRAALLVDWLNELVYLAEAERWVPREVEIESLGETTLRARCRGVVLERAATLVKAATLHRLEIRRANGALEADVILDV